MEIALPSARLYKFDESIIEIKYTPDYHVELEDVVEVEKAFIELSEGGNIYCLMNNAKQFNQFSQEAQKFLAAEASIVKERKMRASAVILDNLPNRILARFFLTFHKPSFKMKIFGNREDALDWLKKVRSGEKN